MHSEGKNTIKLFLSGDVMTGRGVDQILPDSSDPVLYESYIKNAKRYVELAKSISGSIRDRVAYDYVWGDALAELEKAATDVRIINLETAVTQSNDYWPGKGIHYRMHPGNVYVLKEAGIDVCVIANNHILDWGYTGLRETIRILGDNGISVTGAGGDAESAAAPAVIEIENKRILVFSYATPDAGVPLKWRVKKNTPGVNLLDRLGSAGVKKVKHDVDLYRHEGDCVVISLHWGGNWGYEVSSSERKFAHKLIDSGYADLIHGHSSHHPKGIEVYRGRLILYGCGDLINDYEGIRGYEQYRDDLSLLYFPVIDTSGRLISLKMTPMKIERFRLNRAGKNDRDWLADRMNRVCAKFGSSIVQTKDGRFTLKW